MQKAKKTETACKKPGRVQVRKRIDEQSQISQPNEKSRLSLPSTSTVLDCSGVTSQTKDMVVTEKAHKLKEPGLGQKVLSRAFPTSSFSVNVRSSRTKKNYTVPVVRLNSSARKAGE